MPETEPTPEAPEVEVPEVEETPAAAPSPKPEAPKPEAPKPAPPKDGWTPPSKAEFEDLQRKYKATNAENADRRKKLEAFERERESEQEKAVREAREAALLENKPAVVDAKAESAFLRADARPERVEALTRFLNLDEIQVEGRKVTGLDDQVTKLKSEYPEFFKAETAPEEPKKVTPKIPVGNKPPSDKPRTIGEQIAAMRNQN